jgi:hypothetical protein
LFLYFSVAGVVVVRPDRPSGDGELRCCSPDTLLLVLLALLFPETNGPAF